MTGQGYPLELSIGDINDYLVIYESPVELELFVDCIFELDSLFMEKVRKDMKKPSK